MPGAGLAFIAGSPRALDACPRHDEEIFFYWGGLPLLASSSWPEFSKPLRWASACSMPLDISKQHKSLHIPSLKEEKLLTRASVDSQRWFFYSQASRIGSHSWQGKPAVKARARCRSSTNITLVSGQQSLLSLCKVQIRSLTNTASTYMAKGEPSPQDIHAMNHGCSQKNIEVEEHLERWGLSLLNRESLVLWKNYEACVCRGLSSCTSFLI